MIPRTGKLEQPEHNEGNVHPERWNGLALFAITFLVIALCLYLASPFLPALCWAIALSIVGVRIHAKMERRFKKPSICAAISVVVVAVAIVTPCILLVMQAVQQVGPGIEQIREHVNEENLNRIKQTHPRLGSAIDRVQSEFNFQQVGEQIAKGISGVAVTIMRGSALVVMQLLLTLFFLFFFLRDRRDAHDALHKYLPLERRELDHLLKIVTDIMEAVVKGTLVIALARGVLGGVIFWLLGLPAPALFGTLMAFSSFIPAVGSALIWVPVAVVLAIQGNWSKAIILTAAGILVIGLIDNLLYPILVGTRTRLHTMAVFIAIVGGVMLFGLTGVVLGPLAFGIALALMQIWRRRSIPDGSTDEELSPIEEKQAR